MRDSTAACRVFDGGQKSTFSISCRLMAIRPEGADYDAAKNHFCARQPNLGFRLSARRPSRAAPLSSWSTRATDPPDKCDSRITPSVTIGLGADVGHHSVASRPIAFSQLWGSQSTDTHAAAMCGYCGASARIKFDDEQFAALFNELQARGDKTKLMQVNDRDCFTWYTFLATIVSEKVG